MSGVLDLWEYAPAATGPIEVPPDGCRDIIVVVPATGPASWMLTGLSATTEHKTVQAGTILRGARLRPGAILNIDRLGRLGRAGPVALDDLPQELEAVVEVDADVEEALALLAEQGLRVHDCAGLAGVSERSFQRLVLGATGRTPVFWRQLARARRAARTLFDTQDLLAATYENGFSDQAHLAREMRRWFARPPSAIAQDVAFNAILSASGYG